MAKRKDIEKSVLSLGASRRRRRHFHANYLLALGKLFPHTNTIYKRIYVNLLRSRVAFHLTNDNAMRVTFNISICNESCVFYCVVLRHPQEHFSQQFYHEKCCRSHGGTAHRMLLQVRREFFVLPSIKKSRIDAPRLQRAICVVCFAFTVPSLGRWLGRNKASQQLIRTNTNTHTQWPRQLIPFLGHARA